MDFLNKVIIVTGASSGIGAAAAVNFAKFGGLLTLTGRNEKNLELTALKIKEVNGAAPLIVLADLNNENDVKKIIDKTIEKYKRIDVLVNNAGISGNGSIENTSLEQYDCLMNTNVRAVYHLTMLTVPYLIATKGNIVNVSSVCGLRSFPGILAYCLSKSSIDQLTRCVALELAGKGVRCNSINPGVIVTELQKRGGMDEETYAKFLEHCKTTHALGRTGHVNEVASGIAFLASDMASFITGVNLPVDGGWQAMSPH